MPPVAFSPPPIAGDLQRQLDGRCGFIKLPPTSARPVDGRLSGDATAETRREATTTRRLEGVA